MNIFSPLNSNEFVVAIDAAQPQISGSIYHRSSPERLTFCDLTSFALAIEDVLDCTDEPGQLDPHVAKNLAVSQAGKLATFRLDVMFRQHYSWQGRLVWVEQGTEIKFRSFLELVLIVSDIFTNEDFDTTG